MGKIVAIGGGENGRPKEDGSGHYPYETKSIDEEVLKLTGKPSPRVLFIPTASEDSQSYYDLIRKNFLALGAGSVDPLYLLDKSVDITEIKERILTSDAVYVGGGNTLFLLEVWQKHEVDKILEKAFTKNIVLSGLSAGSICWFSFGCSDSLIMTGESKELTTVRGLGLIDAVHCPHFANESNRSSGLKKIMKELSDQVAIALDNGVALEIIDGEFRVLKSLPKAKAHKTYWSGGEYCVEEIESINRFKSIDELLSTKQKN